MIEQIIRQPGLILPRKHIFLISHMRANTSLFGHLMGSSDDISGYYEMHIGYYSWKSLIRQKLLFHKSHTKTPNTEYYFDKVLHSEHFICDEIINGKNSCFMFMLRAPERTIKSICTLYRRIEPDHEFATVEGASEYYISRIKDMGQMLDRFADYTSCYYLDAESLITNTEATLDGISDWLGLRDRLSPEYKKFELTGAKKYGDSSSNINSGKVSASKESYEDIILGDELLEKSVQAYTDVRNKLLQKCTHLPTDS